MRVIPAHFRPTASIAVLTALAYGLFFVCSAWKAKVAVVVTPVGPVADRGNSTRKQSVSAALAASVPGRDAEGLFHACERRKEIER